MTHVNDGTYCKGFSPKLTSVGKARDFVREAIDGYEEADVALLLASELATNAVTHAASPFEVQIDMRNDGVVHIEVADLSGEFPVLDDPTQRDTHGRGLRMVEAFAAHWGVEPRPRGKAVWFELEAGRAA